MELIISTNLEAVALFIDKNSIQLVFSGKCAQTTLKCCGCASD